MRNSIDSNLPNAGDVLMGKRTLKRKIKPIILVSLLMFACNTTKKTNHNTDKKDEGQLVFQSNFEGSSRVVTLNNSDDDIIGKDTTLKAKNDWVKDLEKGGTDFRIQYTGGTRAERYAEIIPEPGNPKNRVLHFWLNDSYAADGGETKGRVQCAIYNIKPGYKEFYQSVRVFLSDDYKTLRSYPDKISWLTLSEFWNNEWWIPTEKYGFRVGLVVCKPVIEESDLYFKLNAEDAGRHELWTNTNRFVKVPLGKWFVMEYYFKEGDAETGRFYMAITPEGESRQVVFDMTGYTHNSHDPHPDGVTGYNPMKLYTSKEILTYMKSKGKTLQVYFDDFRLWTNKRP